MRLDGARERVVSLSPSTTETMFAVGAKSALVGRSRYCDFPPEARSLPVVGGYADPNLEAILSLKPDLVIGARGPVGPALAERLKAHGATVYFPETESFAQIDTMILGVGERTGHASDATRVVEAIHAHETAIEEAVRGKKRPRVLLVFGLTPVIVAGPKSFPNEMIERAGGTNAVREGEGYPLLGMERVIALDPDMILDASMGEAKGAERIHKNAPGWMSLRAVKSGHVVAIEDETALRPGPRVADGLAVLARAIHPEAKIPDDGSSSP